MAGIDEVVSLLQASIDPKQHREAENALIQQDKAHGFSLLLLEITASDAYPENTRLSSALCFKNLIRRSWTDEEGNHLLPQDDVATIKSQLVPLMVSSPSRIQAQLGDAISVIADSDFPDRWTDLVSNLVQRFSPDHPEATKGVLQVAHSIFRRWRPLFPSDPLFEEINGVLAIFVNPFLALVQDIDAKISQNESNKEALIRLLGSLDVSVNIFYDLTIQDLPPAFEENISALCQFLLKYLAYNNKLLHTDDESESGPLEDIKASIFEVLTMWFQKYEDALTSNPEIQSNNFVPQFVESSWNLLTTIGTEPKYDLLSSRALHFLTSISSHSKHVHNFDNDQTLSQIIEKVILPNITLRDSDVELFEDEPIEYTRRDLEGSDSETRRRAATDFLRQLMQHMQQRVSQIVLQYVNHYLQQYHENKAEHWKSKDTAIYLFCSVAALGQVTAAQGVKSINPYVNVVEFFQQNMAEDLTSSSTHVLLQVDAIKYLYIFRTQLSPQQWRDLFQPVIQHLGSSNYVLHTYSAVAVDRALSLTDEKQEPYIPRDTLKPLSKDIFQRLLSLIERNSLPEKVQENEFLIRCVMRVMLCLKEDISEHMEFLTTNFVNILRLIRHNPSNPRFYHFLFESIGALIRFAGPTQCQQLESKFYETFMDILKDNVQEFVPYIFQLFAALLEANPSASLTDYYQSLIPVVLLPGPWEFKGNTPALVRLLCSLIPRGASSMITNNQIEPTLGIFQKLISSKVHDIYGFDLLETMVRSIPSSALQQYLQTVFNLLLTRLSSSKTENFQARFVRLYHFFSAHTGTAPSPVGANASNGASQGLTASYSTDAVIGILDSIQKDVFAQIYPPIILPQTQMFQKPLDRKLAVISFTKTLGDSEIFAEKFAKGWARTVEGLMSLMVNPPVITRGSADMNMDGQEQDVDDVSFGAGFSPLSTIRQSSHDDFGQIGDLKIWISTYLKEANERHNGRVARFIGERLSHETQQAVVAYMQG